jgi:hypothetical protein
MPASGFSTWVLLLDYFSELSTERQGWVARQLGLIMPNKLLVAELDQEMFRIYQRALSEAKYNASRFLQMPFAHRGLETAMFLLPSPTCLRGIRRCGNAAVSLLW